MGTYEIDTDSGDVRLGVGIICESQQQTGLSNTGVTDQEQFEQVIVSEPRVISCYVP